MARHKPAKQLAYRAREATNYNDAQVIEFLHKAKAAHDVAFAPADKNSNAAIDSLDENIYKLHAYTLADLVIEDPVLFSMIEQYFKDRIIQRDSLSDFSSESIVVKSEEQHNATQQDRIL